ncbi:MAG TPA: translation initiation factor IF-2, partial [Chitinophagales bacterium]|nr:translation initiation factor IF-2 [Chitinophagales bacterium]
KGKGVKAARIKRQKREEAAAIAQAEASESNILQVTEFISVSELASLMNVSATEVISKCLKLGIMVSINQRLDAEVIELVADEFGYKVKFISVADQLEEVEEEEEAPENLTERAPIVTVMGHVDHGKTSLLDFIRRTNVISQEAGGITQHIGAYEVTTDKGKKIVFLDTPGHEAFTAMRARGAKVTDIAVIVIAADDAVMPQTKEAISHAQAAGVPMIFAINKIDKEGANPDKIREQLANMNLLVEEWGGKYQSQEISAKKGINIDKLLDKILLEAELLELKANPNKPASGTVIEASLDKGRGYVATLLVQNGTLRVGDMVVAGTHYGKVKAMFNEKGEKRTESGPASAVLVLGLNGAPQAGEAFKVYEDEQEAKEVTSKREQILREQGLRTRKHITLDEIGRRLALGTFKELNVIVKGDVDGSVQAISDSLQKLSTPEIVVNVVHSAVGQITESDVLLASASDAIIVGFQVRPSVSARKLAEKENIEIRLYSVIYDAIEQIKTAMEGMLEPTIEEKILGNAEVKQVFKVSKAGTIAGCQVVEGKITNKSKLRVVRDGIVVYSGVIDTLKRFKDEVKEVVSGQECGIHIKDYNDVKVGDFLEAYEETEVKRTL